MKFRITEVEVPEDQPSKNATEQQKEVIEFLENVIKHREGPFVLALDSPWGTGKTTIVRMMCERLKSDGYTTINFNAWKSDYVSDPLIPMVAAIEEVVNSKGRSTKSEVFKKFKDVATVLARTGLVAATKIVTMNVVGASEWKEMISSATARATENLIDKFSAEKESLEQFRGALNELLDVIQTTSVKKPLEDPQTTSVKKPLIFFIDELDRCRPSFAMELLERVKHLFDVEKIVFVLSIDKKQLEAITACFYGERIDATEYLRRFIDLDFSLPMVHKQDYINHLMAKYELDDFFASRSKHHPSADVVHHFVDAFTFVVNAYSLSLRVIERCLTRVASVLVQFKVHEPLHPELFAYLIVMKVVRPMVFSKLIAGEWIPIDGMIELNSYVESTGERSYVPIVIQAYLLKGFPDYQKKLSFISILEKRADPESQQKESKHACDLLHAMKSPLISRLGGGFSYIPLARKIDTSIPTS